MSGESAKLIEKIAQHEEQTERLRAELREREKRRAEVDGVIADALVIEKVEGTSRGAELKRLRAEKDATGKRASEISEELAVADRVRAAFDAKLEAAREAERREQDRQERAALEAEHRVFAGYLGGMIASLEREARISSDGDDRFLLGYDVPGSRPREALLACLHDLASDLRDDPLVGVSGLAFRTANIGGTGVLCPLTTADAPELAVATPATRAPEPERVVAVTEGDKPAPTAAQHLAHRWADR